MSKHLQLSIPTPCHENWDNMTSVEKGRFCGSCQRQVVDFSRMSDRQIAMFFKKPSTGSVCGRFMEDQLNRDIEIPKKRIPWIKYFFQFLLPGYLVSCNERTIGKIKVDEPKTETVTKTCSETMGLVMPETAQIPDTNKTVLNDIRIVDDELLQEERMIADTFSSPVIVGDIKVAISQEKIEPMEIKGKVVDENNEAIPFSSAILKGTTNGTLANTDGIFSMKIPRLSENVLIISSVGYEAKEIDLGSYRQEDSLIVQLKSNVTLGEVVIINQEAIKCTKTTGLVSVVIKSKKQDLIFSNNYLNKIKVYPNPVKSGTLINIEWTQSEEGEYILQLFNQTGQLTFNKAMWIDNEARVLNLELPHVAAGSYFLRMTNKQSGKSFSEKIIIQ